jgi:hypothetical protein
MESEEEGKADKDSKQRTVAELENCALHYILASLFHDYYLKQQGKLRGR